ncbi:MAG: hypothetical protein WD158_01185 [Balneolaceae bacterium]
MKTAITTLLFLLSGSGFYEVAAQVTAVMEVRVNVISGASLQSVEKPYISLDKAQFLDNVEAGTFALTVAPGTDVFVHLSENPILENQNGGLLKFESLYFNQISSAAGNHQVSIQGKIGDQKLMKGQYKGAVTAVIEYL